MDIKWKNISKLIAIVLLFTFGLISIFLGFTRIESFTNQDFYQEERFNDQIHQFVDYLSMFELNYLPKDEVKAALTVTKEEIEEHRYRYGDLSEQILSIQNQYDSKIQEAQEANNQAVADVYIAERDAKIADITNNFKSDDYVREKVVKEKEKLVDEHYKELETQRKEFTRLKNSFLYYLKDASSGEIYTNIKIAEGKSLSDVLREEKIAYKRVYSNSEGLLSTEGQYHVFVDDFVADVIHDKAASTYEGQIVIPQTAAIAQDVMRDYNDYQMKQMVFFIYLLTGIAAFVVSILLLKKVSIKQLVPIDDYQGYYNRVPFDVSIGIFLSSVLILLISLAISSEIYINNNIYRLVTQTLTNVIFTSVINVVTLVQGYYLFVRLKTMTSLDAEWKTSLLYRFRQELADMFLNRSVGTKFLVLLLVVFGFGLGAAMVLVDPKFILIYGPAFVLVGLPIFIYVVRRIGYFNRIIYNASELARGNDEPDLPVTGKSVLAKLAGDLNTLKHGVKTSQKAQAKSERLKTELITNVSHDLRTPLTSIITYTELLKSEDLATDDREAYIEIIDRKSKRLKVLIDDLFEATKMASGTIELTKEKVDLVQLLQQALAEYNEEVDESTLQFRVAAPDTPLFAVVDGQKLWRVFDNLISNILKYSLENTRVYISMKAANGKVVMTFKNVTKYELGENIDEMFERFKRGDTSRHTEGSGLGLAIAKSIIDLHEGTMDIEVDGDLFKVTIEMALA